MSGLKRPAALLLGASALLVATATSRDGGGNEDERGDAARARLLSLLNVYEQDERALTSFLPLTGDEQRAKLRARLDAFAADVATIRGDQLDAGGRLELRLIENDLVRTRTRLDWEEADEKRAAPLVPFLQVVVKLERADRDCGVSSPRSGAGAHGGAGATGGGAHGEAGKSTHASRPDGRATAAALDEIARLAKGVRAPADPAAKEAVAGACGDALAVRAALRRTREAKGFLDGWQKREAPADPDLAFWIATPAREAGVALDELAKWLEGEVLEGLKKDASRNAFAIGRDRLVKELGFERIEISPEEMVAFGEAQLKSLQEEIRKETVRHFEALAKGSGSDHGAPSVDPADVTWKRGLELEKADVPPIGEQKGYVYDVGCEAIRFCEEQELFPVPPLAIDCWRLRLSDLETQKTYAYGYYGGNFMGVASPVPEMDSIRKLECLRSNARATTRTVVPHELIPGHHLQAWFARRSAPQRNRFESPFYGEGWAVHCEQTFDEHGFFRTPVERIGHLFWRLLRAARIVVSTKYHVNEMSAPQMVDFMVENAGLERGAAQAEVDRYMTYSPLYQCAYLYGCKQIRDLREECRNAWGARFTELDFNRAVLEQGSLPIHYVREALLAPR